MVLAEVEGIGGCAIKNAAPYISIPLCSTRPLQWMGPSHNWPSQQTGNSHPAASAIGRSEAGCTMRSARAEPKTFRASCQHIRDNISRLTWW